MTIVEAKKYLQDLNISDWEANETWKSGGQGVTLKVYNPSTREYGVFKLPKKSSHSDLERLAREIEILAEVSHSNTGVIPVLKYSVASTSPWYISKLGIPFKEYWLKFRQENEDNFELIFHKALEFIKHILNGLSKLHARQDPIIHRDIKPDNLVIIEDKLYLIDFGVAYWSEKERLTEVNDAVGNKRYSPDIMMNRIDKVTPWLDVFMSSQLFMWMIADKPTKNWDRPYDFRFVKYPQTLGDRILKIYAFTGACSEESVGPKDAGEMLDLISRIFYDPAPPGESDLKKILTISQNVERVQSKILAQQMAKKVQTSKKIEAIKILMSIKIQEINDRLSKFVANLNTSGVNAVVERRKDDALDRLLQSINNTPQPRGHWGEEIIAVTITTKGTHKVHFGLTINIQLDQAESMENPFFLSLVKLLKYERNFFLDVKGVLYNTADLKEKLDMDLIDIVKSWLEDERNWY